MSYGQNAACGLQAIKSLTSATYNGQTSPYLIASGYNQNIFKGDLVALNSNGYIVNLYDVTSYATATSLGVFNGCSYIDQAGKNPIDPASPGRTYWVAGTATLNGVAAVADIIDDPNVIFNVQIGSTTGVIQSQIGMTGSILYNATAATAGFVNGTSATGQSLAVLNPTGITTAAANNLKLLRLVGVTGNNAGLQYNNVEVLIQNHFYCSRPGGI